MKSHTPYCPLPGAYAVAQLNVKATLNGLGDPTALEAAQKLGTAKCLVYLCTVSVARQRLSEATTIDGSTVSANTLSARSLVQLHDLPRRPRSATGRPRTLLNLRDVHPHLTLSQTSYQSAAHPPVWTFPVLELLPVVRFGDGASSAGGDTRLHRIQ